MTSNTGNEVLDESIITISNFAQRVHDSINNLNTSLEENYEEHNDIYQKLNNIDSVHEDIYDKIGQMNANFAFSYITEDGENILTIEKITQST